jgi:solute carrier family 35 protein F1/2
MNQYDGIAEDISSRECAPNASVTSFSSILDLVYHRLRNNWKVIGLGQCLSLLLACSWAAQATLHFNCGLSAPTFCMSMVYLLIAIIHLPIYFWNWRQTPVYCPRLCRRRPEAEQLPTHDSVDPAHAIGEERLEASDNNKRDIQTDNNTNGSPDVDIIDSTTNRPMFSSVRWYLLLAFFDVESNAITMLAFRYTTLTSVTLFGALAIPSAMVISRCIVFRSSRRYRPLHYVGVLVCMVGVVLNVFQDYESDTAGTANEEMKEEYPNKMWGDLCAITGGILYGLNDVLTEVTVSKAGGTTEYLAMVGACGFFISFLQSLLLEREDILQFFPDSNLDSAHDRNNNSETCSQQSGFLLLLAFVGATTGSYVGASRFLVLSEAAFFNLSLLTSDLWSVIFSVVAERIVPRPLFFPALAAVLSGVIIYETAPFPALEKERQISNEDEDGKDGIMIPNGRQCLPQDSESELELYKDCNNAETDVAGVELNNITIT